MNWIKSDNNCWLHSVFRFLWRITVVKINYLPKLRHTFDPPTYVYKVQLFCIIITCSILTKALVALTLWTYPVVFYNEFLINRQIISKKEHPLTICHHHDAKRLHFMWDFVYLNFNWHYKPSCVSVILSLIYHDVIFSQNRIFGSLQFQDHVT